MEISCEAKKRLAHIKSHLDAGFNRDEKISNIKTGSGNISACASGLASHALASALYSWFEENDLKGFKKWLYVGSRLDQLYYKFQETKPDFGRGVPDLFKPLFSDSEDLIDWISWYEPAYDAVKINDPNRSDFLAYQSIVAIRGDWEKLISRSKMILDDLNALKNQEKHILDFEFFLALGEKNVEKMEKVVGLIISEKEMAIRAVDESGYTRDLVSTSAAIYTKIAWRSGFSLKIKSPYIPSEWLPVETLDRYNITYDFLD